MSDVVTGEAVALEVRLARFPSRAIGILVDLVVLALIIFVVATAVDAGIGGLDSAAQAAIGLTTLVAVLVGVPTLIETVTRGRSVGKLVMGLRVVRDDGGPIRFRHAFARALAGVFVDFYITVGVGAIVCSLLNERGKRIGDLLAGTVVVRERVPATGSPLPPMPPQLRGWAQSLELSRLPNGLAMAARDYLTRIHHLSPQVRDKLGADLATQVAQFVAPPAPPNTPAWAYLTTILAERRRREGQRFATSTPPAPAVASPVIAQDRTQTSQAEDSDSQPRPDAERGPSEGERRPPPSGPGGFAPPA